MSDLTTTFLPVATVTRVEQGPSIVITFHERGRGIKVFSQPDDALRIQLVNAVQGGMPNVGALKAFAARRA